MDKFILTLIVTVSTITFSKADEEPQIQIYEIRQTREDRDRDESRIDDPDDSLKSRIEYLYRANYPSKYKKKDVDIVTESLINKLRRIVKDSKKKIRFANQNVDNDYMASYKDLKYDYEYEDSLKNPLVLVAHKDVLYHIIPQNERHLPDTLQTALRSINEDEDIEDRTAPPRTRFRYEYEYED